MPSTNVSNCYFKRFSGTKRKKTATRTTYNNVEKIRNCKNKICLRSYDFALLGVPNVPFFYGTLEFIFVLNNSVNVSIKEEFTKKAVPKKLKRVQYTVCISKEFALLNSSTFSRASQR